MYAKNVTTSSTIIAAASGDRRFVHIQNVSDTDMYLAYDGAAAATTAAGFLLAAGQTLMLNNDGMRDMFNRDVYAIHAGVGNKEVRVQGAGAIAP